MNTFFEWAFSAKPAIKIGFEDVIQARCDLFNRNIRWGLIHTMAANETCFIEGTLSPEKEEQFINDCLTKYMDTPIKIILYGRNSTDETPYHKYKQLLSYGIGEVYIYSGGLFEWLLLQDIYGTREFPTNVPCRDMLLYRPTQLLNRDN